jgi:hypothetical protein
MDMGYLGTSSNTIVISQAPQIFQASLINNSPGVRRNLPALSSIIEEEGKGLKSIAWD